MSKQVISQVMKQTCDVCGAFRSWEMIGADGDRTTLDAMQKWFQVGRKVVSPSGELLQLVLDVCSAECGPAAFLKLMAVPSGEPADDIDLAALRAPRLN